MRTVYSVLVVTTVTLAAFFGNNAYGLSNEWPPDYIKYDSYEIPPDAENPDDYVPVDLGCWNAGQGTTGTLPVDVKLLPGYIEVYNTYPCIPLNRAYLCVTVDPRTGLNSLEEIQARCEKVFELIEDFVYCEETEPGKGEWGIRYPEDSTREERVAINSDMCTIMSGYKYDPLEPGYYGSPFSWGVGPAHKSHYGARSQMGLPKFLKVDYLVAKEAARRILGTDDVTLDKIIITPPFMVFKGAGHTLYMSYGFSANYFIDEAVEEIFPELHSGMPEPIYPHNPDFTPIDADENRQKWEERENQYIESGGEIGSLLMPDGRNFLAAV